MKRLTNLTAFLSVVVFVGCVSSHKQMSESDRDKLLIIWQSKDATPEKKVAALNRFIPKGTDGEFVKQLLGSFVTWNRYHGPTLDYYGKKKYEDHDFWTLESNITKEEFISLSFHQVPSDPSFHVLFDGATIGRRLQN
jgi:hypothetical protein